MILCADKLQGVSTGATWQRATWADAIMQTTERLQRSGPVICAAGLYRGQDLLLREQFLKKVKCYPCIANICFVVDPPPSNHRGAASAGCSRSAPSRRYEIPWNKSGREVEVAVSKYTTVRPGSDMHSLREIRKFSLLGN
jgi:hypothetical protein